MNVTLLAAATIALSLTANAALADERAPTPDERAGIESALRSAGYDVWSSIELDDGRWEVDNAKGADGRNYDLELDRTTLAVVSQELED